MSFLAKNIPDFGLLGTFNSGYRYGIILAPC